MTETTHSLDQLLEAIRREANACTAQQILEPVIPVTAASVNRDNPPTLDDLPTPALAITLPLLLAIKDQSLFVECAYQQFLGRSADPQGKAHHLNLLTQGTLRSRLLHDLQTSAEASAYGTTLKGMDTFARLYTNRWLKRLPKLQTRLACLFEKNVMANSTKLAAFEAEQGLLQKIEQSKKVIQRLQQAEQTAYHLMVPATGKLSMIKLELERLRLQLSARPEKPSSDASDWPADNKAEAFYLAFENACRGSEDEIRTQFLAWLKHVPAPLAGKNQVLDIGCGRGEWLQLLRENGYEPTGIDTNTAMINHCKNKGLNAQTRDALQWLQHQPDNSLCAITAFHVIEHIPFELLLQWTSEAYRVLQPGGVLIYETPNPENILVASHTFYHDPTHRNPLTPTLLDFLANYCGFEQSQLVRLHPYPDDARVPGNDPLTERINGHFCGPQDIGLVAAKAQEPACV